MKFSPGDKVSFINEKQNGTVVKSYSDGRVLVEVEDGFEFEVLEKELVKIESNFSKKEAVLEKQPIEPLIENRSTPLLDLCPIGSICLASAPTATGAVLTGSVNYYLLNNSDFDLVYTWFLKKNNKISGITKGILEKQQEVMLKSYRRENLIDITSFVLEALLFFEEKRPAINHIRKETDLLLPIISNTQPGAEGISAFAKVVEVFSSREPEPESIKDLVLKLNTKEKNPDTNFRSSSKISDPNKYGILLNEKVIDLHIEELTPDFSGLSNAEMIAIQMKHFAKEMDYAIRNHFKRIVFIHGVGNGVLKKEIRSELTKYNGISVRDGDFSKYGYGATEINWY